MHVRTDDDIYRVDSVWLGPPRATFPWRVRYVGYGVGLVVMILVMFVQRRVGIGLDFFSVAWALIVTVVVTRFVGSRINYERPLGQVLALFGHEVSGPRRRTAAVGGPVRSRHVRVRSGTAPHPAARKQAGKQARKPAWQPARTADRQSPWTATGHGRAVAGRPAARQTRPAPDPWARSRRDPWAAADRRQGARGAKGRGRRATA